LQDYEAAPVGRWVNGSSFLLWTASPTLGGAVYFARPTEEEWTALLALANLIRHPAFRSPFDCVIDASGLDELPTAAFEALVEHVAGMQVHARLLRRVGCVRPRGMLGATLAGVFYEGVRTNFEAGLFERPAEAFAWLGRPDSEHVAAEVARLVAEVRGGSPVLTKLRAHIASQRGQTDLAGAARAIGVAQRSLQRHLREADTTFRAEIEGARIAAAERMLLDADLKVESIASRAGFASASHLARAFRKHTGESPAEFRRRRRAG
jgi:AraC-like DNA-binding protein